MKLYNWNTAKNKVHDISGITNPENYLYTILGGIYYPYKKM